jgi:hypothetical protein
MTPTHQGGIGSGPMSQFEISRARALRERIDHRNRAIRTVAGQARDRDEFTGLLSMLGLDDAQGSSPALSTSLARYVQQVAAVIGVPPDAVGYEVSDTATAYLGLTARSSEYADRDLMLVWDERLGWYVGVETNPDETSHILCYFGGDTVPPPAAVGRFVAETVAGSRTDRLRPVLPPRDRLTLAKLMARRTTP